MERYYSYAGVNICIHGDDELMYTDDRMLAPFRCDTLDDCDHFYFIRVDELDEPKGRLTYMSPSFCEFEDEHILRYVGCVNDDWKNAYLRVEHVHKNHYVQFKSASNHRIGTHVVFRALESERLIALNQGLLLHSSYINYKNKGILFTAPSGTGKSTQADLWHELRGAEILNGDRCAIRKIDGIFYTMGVPFSGSSNICKNVTLPLSCIVYLGQAKSTTITKLEGYEAFKRLWEGVGVNLWDKENTDIISTLVSEIVENIPIYYLNCTPDELAVQALEGVLNHD